MSNETDVLPSRAELDRLLSKAKTGLFLKNSAGFFGSLLCNHEFVWSEEIPTASCNGSVIKINPHFFFKLSPECRITLIVHELDHTAYLHMVRIGNRCPTYWNYAADYVINNDLDRQGYSFADMHPLLDHKYDGMSTEEVYDLIAPPQGQQSNPNNPDPYAGFDLTGDVEDPNQPGSDTGDEGAGVLSTQAKLQDIISKVVTARQVAQLSNEAGSIPGEIEQVIDAFLNPILPWEVLLHQFMNDVAQDDYTWRIPSRRHQDIYLPSMSSYDRLEHLAYYIDVSGSVTDCDVKRINTEVKHIHENLRPKKLTLITFDTKIQDIHTFTEDMPYDQLTIHGRGGTSLRPVYEHIRETQPTAAVIFSDLYCSPMHQNPNVPILWIVVGHPEAEVNFGKMIHIDNE